MLKCSMHPVTLFPFHAVTLSHFTCARSFYYIPSHIASHVLLYCDEALCYLNLFFCFNAISMFFFCLLSSSSSSSYCFLLLLFCCCCTKYNASVCKCVSMWLTRSTIHACEKRKWKSLCAHTTHSIFRVVISNLPFAERRACEFFFFFCFVFGWRSKANITL